MARYKKQGVFTDGQGAVIPSATINVYLAGTTTAASIYTASSGGAAVNSVTSGSDGKFEFWVDDTDYDNEQLFKIELSKTGYQSLEYDNIIVFPQARLIMGGTTQNLIDGRTYPREITLGATRMEHTPAIAGTRALHIDAKPTGFDDTNCMVLRLDLEGGAESIRPKCINMNVDISGATNAHVNLAEFAKTGDKDASLDVDAIDIRPGVRPIHHHSATIGTVDNAFKYDDSGASYTDVTTEFGSAGSDISIFDEDDDLIYLGHASKFDTIEVILATVADNPGVKPTFEYSKGAGVWGVLAVSDDTNGFRENGNIFYSLPSDWAVDTVNAVASKFWVRIKRTTNTLSTIPTEDTIRVASSTEYIWDENGNLTINGLSMAGTLVMTLPQINDTSSDHQYVFAVNELAADRTVTLPLLTTNDEFVFKDHAVTLTNKTLTSPTIGDASNIVNATTAVTGVVELATSAEVLTGADAGRVPSVASMISHEGMCKGWINFNGTGTAAIRDSFNVSSLQDNNTGDFTVNWDTDFANANYSITFACNHDGTDFQQINIYDSTSQAAGSVRVRTGTVSGATENVQDLEINCIHALGDR
jgi:hypothetical protein